MRSVGRDSKEHVIVVAAPGASPSFVLVWFGFFSETFSVAKEIARW